MPAKKMTRKSDIPYQLLAWHEHVAFMRDKHPNVPYKDLLKMASKTYKGGAKKKTVKRRAGMEDPHEIAGKKRKPPPKRGRGLAEPNVIAGAKRRKPPPKRGRGLVSDVAHGVGSIADLLGLGKRKPAGKRSKK